MQKFGIVLAESNALRALEWRFGQPNGTKLALERRLGRPNGVKLALERRFGLPDDAKLALERRFGRPDGTKLVLEWRFWPPDGAKLALERCLGRLERSGKRDPGQIAKTCIFHLFFLVFCKIKASLGCQVGPGTAFWTT